ncbi:hypothetical protein BGZ65_002690 [Modicella reniformis]|uniref:D-arabinono-1,4-lactone oxidase C-terminal domain-containing protein n=1 Tax=Modicella reniformis TaxID=1440133 RepID=A0A9P6J107_9FUNG|nr:hypothetical protein BGZ65_002690 [Modicella reniformis]
MFNLRMTDTFPLLNEFTALELKTIVLNNDQTEIFYWPFNSPGLNSTHDRIWVKQWQRTTDPVTDPEIVVQIRKFFQNYETKFGDYLFQYIAAHPCSTPFLNHYVFKALEGDHEVVLQAPDAIHYQGGIDNVPCLDLEMAFKVDDNFENVVTAWKYVVEQLYEYANRGEYPFNLTMEMRFVKSSTKLMSNVYDEDPKAIYCTMEILSIKDTEGFDEFSGNIGNYWMRELRAQPHWAKMWEVVPGIVPYLRNQAHERYDRFNEIRRKYDPEGMFMNSTFAGVLNETVPSLSYLGREYPAGADYFHKKLKNAFLKNKDLTDPVEIQKRIDLGDYVSKEIEAMYHINKYRAMKKRYYEEQEDQIKLENTNWADSTTTKK